MQSRSDEPTVSEQRPQAKGTDGSQLDPKTRHQGPPAPLSRRNDP